MIPLSRTELKKIKNSQKLAMKGHSLLKRKRDGLIRKFFELISNYKTLKAKTINDLNLAYERLHIAQGVSGVNRVKGLSFSSNSNLKVNFDVDKIMGVEIQKVSCNDFDVDYNASLIGTSIDVDRVRDNFKKILPNMLKLSEIENTIFRLSQEIIKTKRRVNSLEFIKIPKLEKIEKNIRLQLEEMEREAFIRLKNVKKKIECRAES